MTTNNGSKRMKRDDGYGRSSRFYKTPNGLTLPSVTTILSVINKPALVNWAAKVERELVMEVSADLYQDTPAQLVKMSRAGWITTMQDRLGKTKAAQRELAKATEIGSQVHRLIEWTLHGELCEKAGPSPQISEKAQWAFMTWEEWRHSVKLRPVYVEQVVWSDVFGYAGTMDLLAEVNDRLTVIDWKTGKAVYPEAFLQNAAYRKAFREMGHGDPESGLIVRLPKTETDPEFEVVEVPGEDECFEAFINAKRLWDWQQAIESRKKENLIEEAESVAS